MEKLKELYNYYLRRYYTGVNYIEQHLDEADKYIPAILDLLDRLNWIIQKIGNMTDEEILGGFYNEYKSNINYKK